MDLQDLQKHLDNIIRLRNNQGVIGFDGYSPDEMHQILYFPFEGKSPIKLLQLEEEDFEKIPILQLITCLTNILQEKGEIKLTKKGFLPVKLVAQLHATGLLQSKFVAKNLLKVYKETDELCINVTHILIVMSGLAKKRKGILSLTRKGTKLLTDRNELLRTLIKTFMMKFNWAYCGFAEDERIGQIGSAFSLILLDKYGDQKRADLFYAEKYFAAFPGLLDVRPRYMSVERYTIGCYSYRIFELFLRYFGLVELEFEGEFLERRAIVKKSALFDRLIQVADHKPSRED